MHHTKKKAWCYLLVCFKQLTPRFSAGNKHSGGFQRGTRRFASTREQRAVLYIAAVLSAQIAAVEDWSAAMIYTAQLERATEYFQNAAGILQYIREEAFFKLAVAAERV